MNYKYLKTKLEIMVTMLPNLETQN